MKEMYAWVPWFQELAGSIADGTPEQLAERAERLEWRDDGGAPPLLRYGQENVDPFSFIYSISANCGGRKSRARLIGSISSAFQLKAQLPVDLDDAFYFPQGLPLAALFHQRGIGNPELLWKLFRDAVRGAGSVRAEDFDTALKIGNVGVPKLTQTLFLINGQEFAPYDKSTRSLLGSASPAKPDWRGYRQALNDLCAGFPGCELYEINLFAYLTQSGRLAVGSSAFQVSTNVFNDEEDHWDTFDRESCVYTGARASGVKFGQAESSASRDYPLRKLDKGDIVLVRNGRSEGRGIGIVWKNDYRKGLTERSRLHVIWLNKEGTQLDGTLPIVGFSRAQDTENTFRQHDSYQSTFAILDELREVEVIDGLTKAAVLSALAEFDQLGREAFLESYGPAPSRTRWLLHEDNRYDMKPVWRAAFGHMDGGTPLTPDDERHYSQSDHVQKHLEKLGFTILADFPKVLKKSDQPLNQILYGPPGTGKTWHTVNLALNIIAGSPKNSHDRERFQALKFDPTDDSGNIAMVTFHQNFAYEDFVEGIRPVLNKDEQGLRYELVQGLFQQIATVALNRQDERFVLIIDEINRGNVARIFGELITLIEDSRRIGNGEETFVTLPYSKNSFGVPNNLFLIGTMNTADRSIQLLDTALRRRFAFVEMMPDPDHQAMAQIEGLDCGRMLKTINERIGFLLDREHQIGHTYLLDVHDMKTLADRFRTQVFPLLQEYFFDDWSKIKSVLGGSPFVVESTAKSELLDEDATAEDRKIFGRLPDHDLRWESSDSYRAIYEAKQAPAEAA